MCRFSMMVGTQQTQQRNQTMKNKKNQYDEEKKGIYPSIRV